jgi:hypothetical protein
MSAITPMVPTTAPAASRNGTPPFSVHTRVPSLRTSASS